MERLDGIICAFDNDIIISSPVFKLITIMAYIMTETEGEKDKHLLEGCLDILEIAYLKAKPHNYN